MTDNAPQPWRNPKPKREQVLEGVHYAHLSLRPAARLVYKTIEHAARKQGRGRVRISYSALEAAASERLSPEEAATARRSALEPITSGGIATVNACLKEISRAKFFAAGDTYDLVVSTTDFEDEVGESPIVCDLPWFEAAEFQD